MHLVLASASPARLATLRSAGIEPVVIVSGVDESQVGRPAAGRAGPPARRAQVRRGGRRDDLPAGRAGPGLRLGARARRRGAGQAGRRRRGPRTLAQPCAAASGVLHTGHACTTRHRSVAAATASTTVHFADVTDAEIAAYVATGEPLYVAGAFTVDGLGGAFVTGIEGDHHNVVGVSLPLLRELLRSWVTRGPTCGGLSSLARSSRDLVGVTVQGRQREGQRSSGVDARNTNGRNRKNRAALARARPMTLAAMLSEIGSSRPRTSRLIHRQLIGISIVTRLITTNATTPPSACPVGAVPERPARLPR